MVLSLIVMLESGGLGLLKIESNEILSCSLWIEKVTLEQVIKELNKSQSIYTYCIKKKDINLILEKEKKKTGTKYGDMLLGFGKKK